MFEAMVFAVQDLGFAAKLRDRHAMIPAKCVWKRSMGIIATLQNDGVHDLSRAETNVFRASTF